MCDQQRLRPACTYAQSDQSLCWSLEYSMNTKLLTKHNLEHLRLKGGCRCTLDKMPHCWKSQLSRLNFVLVEKEENYIFGTHLTKGLAPSESLGLEHCTLVHFLRMHCRSHRKSKVVLCRQLITLVKPISREILSEVGQIISLT